MSEAELVGHVFSIWDRYWTIVQWWASVSFSLILVAYFASDRLGKGIVAALLTLYTLYSIWVSSLMGYNLLVADGLLADIEALRVAGDLNSLGALAVLQESPTYGFGVSLVALLLTFIACAGYLVYAFLEAKKSPNT